MSLAAGTSLAQYRLVGPLGEGGMGVVWRATDSTLGRDAAIKVLPDVFANDPERLARFDREARLLASLNHPNIASIYGVHEAQGLRFLALELIDGEDLAQRIQHGPVPVAEALPIALQVAHALEHAHEKGVIHRDLKPGNIKLTAGGQAKVLDFGLAKALEGDASNPGSSSMISHSPTITGHMTGMNVLLGTAAYMAPEQARGHAADKRADIWSFGAVLMEMLTGKRLFEGETISDTLASVLRAEPEWETLPADTPQRIRGLIRRCLERNPKQRLRDIGEARILLEEVIAAGPDGPPPPAPAAATRSRLPLAVTALVAFVAGALVVFGIVRRPQPAASGIPMRKFHLAIPPDEGGTQTQPVISPDGRTVAYLVRDHIWIQALGELEPKRVAADPGAARLFWSPDGKWIGYFTGTRIMKTAVGGNENQAVCDMRGAVSGGQGVCWKDDGNIVFSRGDSAGLLEVPALGGDPHVLLAPDSTEGDLHEPSALPGGRGVLFCGHRTKGGINNIVVWSGGKRRTLFELEDQRLANPVYSPSGHILFQRAPTTPGIWALPFSLDRLAVTGEPFLVAAGATMPAVSNDGTLVYVVGGTNAMTQMTWVDRDGKELGVIGQPETEATMSFSLSPDGTMVARSVTSNENADLWIYDTARGTRTRLTFDPGLDAYLAWSPKGDRVTYHTQLKGSTGAVGWRVLLRAADGTGAVDSLGSGVDPMFTPDGKHVIYAELLHAGALWNLMERSLDGPPTPRMLVRGNPWVVDGRVSPSGTFMAYMSHESGEWQIFMTRYPSAEGKWQVSVAGGQWPQWNAKGDRLYFVQAEDVMEVEVGGTGSPVLGTPHRLFARQPLGSGAFGWYPAFSVNGDGSRFVVLRGAGPKNAAAGIAVVQNWIGEFTAAAPRK